jgi:hypothetical protein
MPSQSQKSPDPPSPSSNMGSVGEANLVFYMRDRFAPVLEQVKLMDTWTRPHSRFLSAEMLEAFLWLHHGVSIKYFALPLSRRITYEFFPLVLKAYELLSAESYFETWFTPPLRLILELELTGKQELFSFGPTWESLELDAIFQSFSILANELVQNHKARPLMQAVAVADDSEWKNAILRNTPVAGLEQPNPEDSLHWTYSGFFAVLEYMQAYRRMKSDIVESGTNLVHPNVQDHVRLLKETQEWRLNFGYPKYRERFMEVARMAGETCVRIMPEERPGSSGDAVAQFVKSVYELMTDWGAPLTKGANA